MGAGVAWLGLSSFTPRPTDRADADSERDTYAEAEREVVHHEQPEYDSRHHAQRHARRETHIRSAAFLVVRHTDIALQGS